MFDWVFAGRPSVYLLLGVLAGTFLVLWWKRRQRPLLLAAGIVLVLAGLYFALDRLVETDRKQIRGRIQAMAASVKTGDLDPIFRNLSDRFRTTEGRGKQEFYDLARDYRGQSIIEEVVVWDFQFPDAINRSGGKARASFLVKGHGSNLGRGGNFYYLCEAVFDHSLEHGWRLLGFELFDPNKTNEKLPFPY